MSKIKLKAKNPDIPYKYLIGIYLKKLNHENYLKAKRDIPKILGTNWQVVSIWMNIKLQQNSDIKYLNLVTIASYLSTYPKFKDITAKDLCNFEINKEMFQTV